jgi:hypothetical protein
MGVCLLKKSGVSTPPMEKTMQLKWLEITLRINFRQNNLFTIRIPIPYGISFKKNGE